MNASKQWDYKHASPFLQGGVILGLILLFNLFSLAGGTGENSLFKPNIYWINTIAFLLVYALFNSVLSAFAEDQNVYWGKSIGTFAAICVLGGLMAYGFSGLTIDEAGSFRWLYMVFAMGYIIFLAMIRTIRKIIKIAQKQDKGLRGEQ